MHNSRRGIARIENVGFQQTHNDAALDRIISTIRERGAFNVARAMTATIKDTQRELTALLPVVLDRPNPWTRQAIGITPATREALRASVFVKDSQAQYLRFQIEGGQRSIKPFEIRFRSKRVTGYMIPSEGSKLDQFGNVSKADIVALGRALSAPDAAKRYFVGEPQNSTSPPGVYERTAGGGLRLVFLQSSSARYAPLFDFFGVARATIRATFRGHLIQSFR